MEFYKNKQILINVKFAKKRVNLLNTRGGEL